MLFIGLLLVSFISAQTLDTSGLEETQEQIEGVTETFEEVQRWDYLSGAWRDFFLQNSIIASIDGFLKKIDLAIFILIGEHYELGLTFIVSVALWLLFFIFISRALTTFSTLKKGTSLGIGIGIAVLLGHAKIYSFISEFIFRAVFFRGGVWAWLWAAFLVLGYFLMLSYVEKILMGIKKSIDFVRLKERVDKTEAFVKGAKKMSS